MKRQDAEAGSAHVFVIVLLIVAILGLLGYVGYTAFTKQSAKQTAQTASQNTTPETASTPKTREVIFENWNVAINVPYTSNLYAGIAAPMTDTSDYDGYYVYDTDFDRTCAPDQYKSIGAMTRVKADAPVDTYITDESVTNRQYFTKNTDGAVILGDYVYYFTKPNGSYGCTDPSNKNNAAAIAAVGNARTTLYDAIDSMHVTTK